MRQCAPNSFQWDTMTAPTGATIATAKTPAVNPLTAFGTAMQEYVPCASALPHADQNVRHAAKSATLSVLVGVRGDTGTGEEHLGRGLVAP
jgi:hypothetical protein